jgi:hypothetical protein
MELRIYWTTHPIGIDHLNRKNIERTPEKIKSERHW